MFTAQVIGNLGADAELKTINGKVYLTFRVAHSEKFTKQDGSQIEETTWISCITSQFTSLHQYLKRGQKVFVSGDCKASIVWKPKTRENVVGLSINVRSIELCGGSKQDDIPPMLYDEDGVQRSVTKLYWVDVTKDKVTNLWDSSSAQYVVNEQGFVLRLTDNSQQSNNQDNRSRDDHEQAHEHSQQAEASTKATKEAKNKK